ncbi:TRAP transporter small permease [Fodinibius salsisoli]|uniref:TRAP transporter small permease n=1 Tax=Fodinibius salsisoli TaxID=2820877 RepID=A0ABT3PKV2_9BACT|nr:TRAP transporter small permease [Fodinibius salsisoli]MCW9706567.1 TRAP transporter small permease [Fodinibius salsisoli]
MKKNINKFVGSFLSLLMGIMLVCVLWQVFTRYVMGEASTFTEELARFLLIWIGMLGAAYISGENGHLAIDLLPRKLEGENKRKLQIGINLIIILFVIVALIIGGGQLVYISYILNQTSAALQIPLAYVYLILPVSGLLICYYKVLDFIQLQQQPVDSDSTSPVKENI